MPDIALFEITDAKIDKLQPETYRFEKELQKLFEDNLENFLGIVFLKTEHIIKRPYDGRIDTLGIDENLCPVIIEYKRHSNQNIINQGLFYFDWLMDHQGDFRLIVQKKLNESATKTNLEFNIWNKLKEAEGKKEEEAIDWQGSRLICIANDFDKYDSYAVNQIGKNIELLKYKKYGDNFLIVEFVNSVAEIQKSITQKDKATEGIDKITVAQACLNSYPKIKILFDELQDYTTSLGNDIEMKGVKHYFAFRTNRNFACIEPLQSKLLLTLHLNLDDSELEEKFSRNISEIGTKGTGNIELTIKDTKDIEKAKDFIERAYKENQGIDLKIPDFV